MPRQLPSAPEAEASLLGTMLVYPASTRIAMEEGLSEDDFFVEANRKIFRVASDLYNSGQQIDLPKDVITEAIAKLGKGESVRGESLSLEEFAALSNDLWEKKGR